VNCPEGTIVLNMSAIHCYHLVDGVEWSGAFSLPHVEKEYHEIRSEWPNRVEAAGTDGV
jgi:hypothetical protein